MRNRYSFTSLLADFYEHHVVPTLSTRRSCDCGIGREEVLLPAVWRDLGRQMLIRVRRGKILFGFAG
ncbi:MAG TPA: hypothetical protein VIH42_03055, partial [Thermoguttaceae bacterium]